MRLLQMDVTKGGTMTIYKYYGKKALYMKRYCSTNLQKSFKERDRQRDWLISKHLANKDVDIEDVELMYRMAHRVSTEE